MKVLDLIKKLQEQNQDAEVQYSGDGRWSIESVERSLSDDNLVLISF